MKMNILMGVIATLIVVALVRWAIASWKSYESLGKYGISYKITSGEHEEFQTLQFFWKRNQNTVDGPLITRDDLYVDLKYIDNVNAPEIVVRSETLKGDFAIFRLNFEDKTKPEFELIENHMMGIEYTPPWSYYYTRDPNTEELEPEPAK